MELAVSAERDAIDDARLRMPDRKVYKAALRHLSYYQPRTLKVRAIARTVLNRNGQPMNPSTVWRAIERLRSLGYLERGPMDGRRRTYLLRAEISPQIPQSPPGATTQAA
jgi:hypothetical protein